MSASALGGPPPAIVITYEPDSEWPERLRAVLKVCPRCIVVDNSVTDEARARVRAIAATHPGVELIANLDNPGIGRALNQGCATLHPAGDAWVIAFDQDSTPHPEMGTALLAIAQADPRPVAMVGANWQDAGRPGHPSRHVRAAPPFSCGFQRTIATEDLADVLCVITSGSLISLAAWTQLGGFDEGLFLDLVDTDFCLRARAADWSIVVSAKAKLEHQRGTKLPVRFMGWTFYPSFMPPFRLQCLSRNRIRLIRRHGWREPAWVAYELVYAAKLAADLLLLEDKKYRKFLACLRGTWDGLFHPAQPTLFATKVK